MPMSEDEAGEESSSEIFTNETIARTDKKNVVKNFVKAFISDVRKNPNVLLDSSVSDDLNNNNSDNSSKANKITC